MGADFQQHEAGLIGADEVPILTTVLLNWHSNRLRRLMVAPGYRQLGA